MRAKRRTREEWEKIISELLASGLTTAQFSEQRDLHPQTTACWKSRLAREGIQRPKQQSAAGFVEVITGDTATCELRLKWGDAMLEFGTLPPTDWLVELLDRC